MGVYGGGFLKGICYGSDPVVISLQLTNIQGLIGLNKYGQHLLRQTINVFHYKLGGAPLSRNTQSNYHTVTMCCLEELLRWHHVYKLGEDELYRPLKIKWQVENFIHLYVTNFMTLLRNLAEINRYNYGFEWHADERESSLTLKSHQNTHNKMSKIAFIDWSANDNEKFTRTLGTQKNFLNILWDIYGRFLVTIF